jgi:hypothetical protein
MRRYIAVLLGILACAPVAAQTYKWVDERGVTTYGTKPPPGRPAQLIDTNSRNTIDTADVARREADEKRYAVVPLPPPPPITTPTAPVRGMAFDTYIRLERGMSEGEVVFRAGSPDYVSFARQPEIVKSFYYYPTSTDPFTTIVTLRGGRIDNIERTKKH